jgi:hypothetical protein
MTLVADILKAKALTGAVHFPQTGCRCCEKTGIAGQQD